MPTQQRIAPERQVPRCATRFFECMRAEDALRSVSNGDVVLDFGCGDAHLRPVVERAGATYVGVDPYSNASDLRCSAPLPLASRSVGTVVTWGVLHLVENPFVVVRELARVLKPGGRLVGYVACLEDMQELARFQMSFLGIDEVCRDAGLELESLCVTSYGLDYQAANLLLPFGALRPVRRALRGLIRHLIQALTAAQGVVYSSARWYRQRADWAESYRYWRLLRTVSFASGFVFEARAGGEGTAPPHFVLREQLRSPGSGNMLEFLPGDAFGARTTEGVDGWAVDRARGCAWPVRRRQYCFAPDERIDI